MNPCPCGFFPDMDKCRCSEHEVQRYLSRVSGPILDRIDICAEAPRISLSELDSGGRSESSAEIRERVFAARDRQEFRFRGTELRFNSDMTPNDVRKFCGLDDKSRKLLENAFNSMNLSARAYHRIIKVARTIADVEGCEDISQAHLSEAICYRMNDMKYWAG